MQDEMEKITAIIRDLFDDYDGPVTRDLSPAKRQAILAWLKNPLPGTVALRATRAAAARPAPTGPMPCQASYIAGRIRSFIAASSTTNRRPSGRS